MNPILEGWNVPPRPSQPRPPGAAVTRLELLGDLTIERSIQMFAEIRAAAADTIELHVDSGGGNALPALALFELLVTHPFRVAATIARASSGAALVAMGADIRHVLPGATVFLHETTCDLKGASADVLRETLADVARFNTLATAIIADACGRTVDEVTQWRGASRRFTAREAREAGLAHEIV